MFVQDVEINSREDGVPTARDRPCMCLMDDPSTLQVCASPEVKRSLKLDVIKYFR